MVWVFSGGFGQVTLSETAHKGYIAGADTCSQTEAGGFAIRCFLMILYRLPAFHCE
jgi:hypothetical protein